MIDFSWRDELSHSFGIVKRPVVEAFVKAEDNIWHALTMYVDSGADVTVINRSIGDLFGHNLKKGRKILMKGFGNQDIPAYVHTMRFKIGKHEFNANVAIPEKYYKESKTPNVLGRKDVFNLFEIQFKNLKKCTRFVKRVKK